MNIENYSQLFSGNLTNKEKQLREIALESIDIAIESVRPKNLIHNSIKLDENKLIISDDIYDLETYNKIYIIGGGKASAEMMDSLKNVLDQIPNITYLGVINIPEGLNIEHLSIGDTIKLNPASHPIPDERGLKGCKEMLELIRKSTSNDIILFLLSGGGSALLPYPRHGISLEDLQEVNSSLLASGASIHEINTIRKHLSEIKGGNLAKKVYEISGATIISLIISDVVGDNLDSIASGPTVADSTYFKDAIHIVKKYNLADKLPSRVKDLLKQGKKNHDLETPKKDNECFKKVHNYLIGSVKSAVKNIQTYLMQQNYRVHYFSDKLEGEAEIFGRNLPYIISELISEADSHNIALIGSGELTVTIKGKGIGGRNQEMLLSTLDSIRDFDINYKFLITGVNLDGIEGNSNVMGAFIDNNVLSRVKIEATDLKSYLKTNDSHSFFKEMQTFIKTGPTGCNVNDIILVLIEL